MKPQTGVSDFHSSTLHFMKEREFYLVTFFGALLLFSLQPMIAGAILPWFGGSAGVWNTCQVFFQFALLVGYLYAHLLLRNRSQVQSAARLRGWNLAGLIHLGLVAASVMVLPVTLSPGWKPTPNAVPELHLVLTLACTIGLPYLALSATSPLVAGWYSQLFPGRQPYTLYAWSNFGSLLGLLGYPFLIQPHFGLRTQNWCWSAGYLLWGILMVRLAYVQGATARLPQATPETVAELPDPASWLLWLSLPMCSSLLLTALTNYISSEVAAVPLFWVIPLALYLISYIVAASSWNLYRRWLFLPAFAVALVGIESLLDPGSLSPLLIVPGLWLCLAVIFVVCHGELWANRPHPSRLSQFYLVISLGGVLGSFVVAYLAPRLFTRETELTLCLFVLPLLILGSVIRTTGLGRSPVRLATVGLLTIPLVYSYGTRLLEVELQYHRSRLLASRNFYGTAWVAQVPGANPVRLLYNGRINHGGQYLDPAQRDIPTGYYSPRSGVGRILTTVRNQTGPIQIGVVGLGVGTLAAYGRPGDQFDFFEIDSKIAKIAQQQFRFLSDSKARVRVLLGDGRLSLEQQPAGRYDVLVIDAFSGDAVPLHLLTREAFQIYERALKPDGILVLHVSNLYIDLPPVVGTQATWLGRQSFQCYDNGGPGLQYPSLWAAVTRGGPTAGRLRQVGFTPLPASSKAGYAWSDDYTDLLQTIKTDSLPRWLRH